MVIGFFEDHPQVEGQGFSSTGPRHHPSCKRANRRAEAQGKLICTDLLTIQLTPISALCAIINCLQLEQLQPSASSSTQASPSSSLKARLYLLKDMQELETAPIFDDHTGFRK